MKRQRAIPTKNTNNELAAVVRRTYSRVVVVQWTAKKCFGRVFVALKTSAYSQL